jgi:hypothetical protein
MTILQTPAVNAQVLDVGKGVCHPCGHAELDTQRYVNSFLNQMFFPNRPATRAAVATSLYLFTATYTMHGRVSPDPAYSSVTIAITAEVKNAIPTGKYHVTATTPSGETTSKTYAIGATRFSVRHDYAPGAVEDRPTIRSTGTGGKGGPGSSGRSGPPSSGRPQWRPQGSGRPAKCSRSWVTHRRNETTVYCSED